MMLPSSQLSDTVEEEESNAQEDDCLHLDMLILIMKIHLYQSLAHYMYICNIMVSFGDGESCAPP